MSLGLGSNLSKGGIVTPGIVTDNLVLKHNYAAGGVVPVSDGAAYFDGTDDYIDVGSKANSGDDLSVSAWVYITDTNAQPIFRWGDFLLQMGSDTNISGWADASDGRNNCTISSIKDQWAHIVTVVDDTDVIIYLNGAWQKTTSVADGLSTDSQDAYIGRYSSNYLKGYICNVGFWSRTLTQAEIKSIMWKNHAGLTDSEKTNLVSWWNLDTETNTSGESGTGGVKDSHGTNHGTLS